MDVNTFVLESMGLMYMDTPKAGGTSLKTRLAQLEAGYKAPHDSSSHEAASEMFIHDQAINPLKPVTAYEEQLQEKILFSSNWKRFCVVRNPFSRLFSAWFSKVLLRQPGYLEALPGYELPELVTSTEEVYAAFERFVDYLAEFGCDSNPHWDRQVLLLFSGTLEWDKVFRFENLQEELSSATDLFGEHQLTLEHLNVSGFSPNWEMISPKTKNLITSLYACDFEAYGYSLEQPRGPSNVDLLPVYINAVVARNKRISQLIARYESQLSTSSELEERVRALEQELEVRIRALEQELEEQTRSLHELQSSRSWRLTAPLRKMKRVIAR